MRYFKKGISAITAAALVLSALPVGGPVVVKASETAETDSIIKLVPSEAATFNDTDGDGLGEYEGWGTSLCWWANRLGYSEAMTQQAATYFFGDDGLDLNIGRYNVGGGDDVSEDIKPSGNKPVSENEVDYVCSAADINSGLIAQYTSDSTLNNLFVATISDVELAAGKNTINIGGAGDSWTLDFIKMAVVGENADIYDLTTSGKKPTYAGSSMGLSTVDFSSTTYMTSDEDFGFVKGAKAGSFKYVGWINGLDGSVGSGDKLHYTVDVDKAGKYTIKLLLTLTGSNDRNVAIRVGQPVGDGSDVSDTEETEAEDPFLHASHITRSDSVVPGYCVDVTAMNYKKHDLSYYQDNYARADEESGYAWNYDWDADANQMNILVAAAKASGNDFIAEAFSNSPPYFMTESGCSSGNYNANSDNLRSDCYTAFACYMADVIEHINNESNGITFQSTTPMNEPYTNYWGAHSNKQEGCHFDQGESQSNIILALNNELKKKGIKIILSASDETSIDTAITSYNKLSSETKSVVKRIDTHTYSGSDRTGLKNLAKNEGKNLWMSEVDGSFTAGKNAGEMSAALGFASRIMTDVNELESTAWILWNAVDMNVDANNKFDMDSIEQLMTVKGSSGKVDYDPNSGYWGIAIGEHNKQEIVLTKKYYAYGQFTKYIRPGMTIIGSTGGETLAAYDPASKKAVIVALNTSEKDSKAKFSLANFVSMGDKVTAIRTSGSLESGENWADVSESDDIAIDSKNRFFTGTLKANSITTYIVEGVTYDKDQDVSLNMEEIELTSDMVSGTAPWNYSSNTAEKVVDGNLSTFFDGLNGGYVIIDLGEAEDIAAISFAPRSGYTSRMTGGRFYGANDNEDWTLLYEVPSAPKAGVLTFAYADMFKTTATNYRYIKYTAADGECANIAEIKLYSKNAHKKIYNYSSFTGTNGDRYYDTNGKKIQAHGGQIQQLTVDGVTKYYWIGEDKTNGYIPCPGIHMYTSTDLYNWTDEGLVLKTMKSKNDFNSDYFSALYGSLDEDGNMTAEQSLIYDDLWQGSANAGCVIERPKMIYNEKTGKYVIWFHADGKTPSTADSNSNYAKAKAGVAISDSPTGPFKLLGTYSLIQDDNYDHSWDKVGGHLRDMNLFVDKDKSAYVIYSSDGNANMYIAKLNDSYTGLAMSGTDALGNPAPVEGKDYTVNFVGFSREAPAMFEAEGKYYMITSGCNGWAPCAASYAIADSVLGEWKTIGNPCVDSGADTTYDTQSTCVVKVAEGKYMYMGDRWYNPDNGEDLSDSRYVWLPIEFDSEGLISIHSYSDWTLDAFNAIRPFSILTDIPSEVSSVKELKKALTSSIEIRYAGETASETVDAIWKVEAEDNATANITVTGELSNGRKVTKHIIVYNENMKYFFDCAAKDAVTGDYYTAAKSKLGDKLLNEEADQAYTAANGAGYSSSLGSDKEDVAISVKNGGDDIWSHGYWAHSNKSIDYTFNLDAGNYAVAAGFYEWWSTKRNMEISVEGTYGSYASKRFILGTGDTANQQTLEFTLDSPETVTVSVSKTSGADPVLSWIALMDNTDRTVRHTLTYAATEGGHIVGEAVQTVSEGTDGTEVEAVADEGYEFVSWSDGVTTAARTDRNVGEDINVTAKFDKAQKVDDPGNDPTTDPEDNPEAEECTHEYGKAVITKATDKKDGKIVEICTKCREERTTVIPAATKLSVKDAVYTGKALKPAVTICYGTKAAAKDFNVALKNSIAYKDNTKVGTATVTVTMDSTYYGTADGKKLVLKTAFKINPKGTSIKSLKALKKAFTVKWKKQSTQTTGYEIQYSTDKNFRKSLKKLVVNKAATTSKKFSKLKAKKKYYIRIRTYKIVKGKKYYSSWSKVKYIKTK